MELLTVVAQSSLASRSNRIIGLLVWSLLEHCFLAILLLLHLVVLLSGYLAFSSFSLKNMFNLGNESKLRSGYSSLS